ncbi:MAG TPA: N-acetylneuraminate synthase family protein [Spirochaetota bacterium]|nr:N-acetylneuraminate synthase family protein [Spirochaetota bacterium]
MLHQIFNKQGSLVFIAEIGLNHNGIFEVAEEMIRQAHSCGADGVKFQTFVPENMYSRYASSLIATGDEKEPSTKEQDFFASLTFTREELLELHSIAASLNIEFFSTPFDEESVELLQSIGVRLFKVASSEVTNHVLLRAIAKTGKPVIMSTGLSTEKEIEMALKCLSSNGTPEVVLLHCVSLYPLPYDAANLSRITALRNRFNCEVGFSDHSADYKTVEIAVALGAGFIEKHFTLSDDFDCPDRSVSLSPEKFNEMIQAANGVRILLGNGNIDFSSAEKDVAKSARRSLFAKRDISKGTIITQSDIVPKRPGTGIPIYMEHEVIGKRSLIDIKKDYMIRMEHIE